MEQTTFLGASVRSFTCSLGWGSNPTELRVSLVNDPSNNDAFSPPNIGSAVYFIFGSLSIGGFLTHISRTEGPEGNPLFEVTVNDPRSILEGVQLILQGYNGGVFNVPNLYNIFGYLEALGDAGTNSSGMEWYKIKNTFLTLQESAPIRFAGYDYYLDLSNLPALPNYYRLGSEHYSMMDFISEICEASGCDFYFRLFLVGTRNVLKIYTISRANAPQFGLISNYLNGITGKVRSDVGFELRNETTSKFLVGGNVAQMFFQTHNSGVANDFTDDVIWPFWGVKEDGDVVIASGVFDSDLHRFQIPSRTVNVVGIGDTYDTNIEEMRAALGGQESWELLLRTNNGNEDSIHFGKAEKVGLVCDITVKKELLERFTLEELEGLTPVELTDFLGLNVKRAGDSVKSEHEENISRLYEYVKTFADDHYGKKFMVRIPFVTAEYDPENNRIVTSLEPTEGGFIEEIAYSGAISNGIMPINTDFVTLDDGRIMCYAKFHNHNIYDFSELSVDDYKYNSVDKSVFVKATLEQDIQFLDKQTAFSPRVVLRLPGRVKINFTKTDIGLFKKLYLSELDKAHPGLTEDQKLALFKKLITKPGSEVSFLAYEGLAVMPHMVAIPLKSNVDFYGPWYSIGAEGKTDFEKDDTLVPWNYGGYALMDLAARARVSEALTNFQVSEGGSIELAGFPSLNLGDALIFGGPYITDMNVNISDQGVTTTYRMQTWTPRFGKVPKTYIDTLQKLKIQERKNRKIINELNKLPPPGDKKFKEREAHYVRSRRKTPHTSSALILGEMSPGEGDIKKANIVIGPTYNILNHLDEEEYDNKVVNSLDVLFRPFTTDTESTELPHFEEPEDVDLTVDDLNPYQDSDFLIYNKDYPEDDTELKDAEGSIRGIALRGPIIIVGWGYDTDGNPVPGEDGEFIEDYKQRMDQWKVGPLDIRWDDDRKVWIGGSFVQRGTLTSTLTFGGNATATDSDTGTEDTVYDHLLSLGQSISSGKKIIYALIHGRKYVIGAECE